MPEQFSRRQVEMILRRTAELERKESDALDEISTQDLEKVAADLGMSQDALRQAIGEAKAGLLAQPEEGGFLDRFFGPGFLEAKRYVPGTVHSVRASVNHFLEEQGFQLRRNRGELTVWEPARDILSSIRRMFGAGAYRLPREIDIEVQVVELPGGPHPVMVRLRVDARRLRGTQAGWAAASVVAGAGMAIAGAVFLPMPTELALMAAGGAAGVAGTFGGRANYKSARERLEIALERFLDFLEHLPLAAAASKDPITRLVEFLSRDWWR